MQSSLDWAVTQGQSRSEHAAQVPHSSSVHASVVPAHALDDVPVNVSEQKEQLEHRCPSFQECDNCVGCILISDARL